MISSASRSGVVPRASAALASRDSVAGDTWTVTISSRVHRNSPRAAEFGDDGELRGGDGLDGKAALVDHQHLLQPGHSAQFVEGDHAREALLELHVHHVPARVVVARLRVEVLALR